MVKYDVEGAVLLSDRIVILTNDSEYTCARPPVLRFFYEKQSKVETFMTNTDYGKRTKRFEKTKAA